MDIMCYDCQEIVYKDKQIADLKEKLAESKGEANDWKQRFEFSEKRLKTFNSNSATVFNLKNEKINKLKQQLAEKEKEIDAINKFLSDKANEIEGLRTKAYVNMLHQEMLELKVSKQDQDKISFAVEQLEKVKEHNDNLVCDDEDYYNYITVFIDNQINQLKEGK